MIGRTIVDTETAHALLRDGIAAQATAVVVVHTATGGTAGAVRLTSLALFTMVVLQAIDTSAHNDVAIFAEGTILVRIATGGNVLANTELTILSQGIGTILGGHTLWIRITTAHILDRIASATAGTQKSQGHAQHRYFRERFHLCPL